MSKKIPKNIEPSQVEEKKPRLSKSEKRLLAKQQKKERFNQKKETLIRSVKEAKNTETPHKSYNPITTKNPDSYHNMMIEWDCKSPDIKGTWSWGIKRKQLVANKKEIHDFLLLAEKSTWQEILNQSSGGKKRIKKQHHQEIATLVQEAQQRWIELDYEFDTAFRFRLAGTKRLWGYRIKNKFFIVWWDPTHKVYPTSKK